MRSFVRSELCARTLDPLQQHPSDPLQKTTSTGAQVCDAKHGRSESSRKAPPQVVVQHKQSVISTRGADE